MNTPQPRIVRIKEITARTGLSRSTIYARINKKSDYYDKTFPLPIPLGGGSSKAVGWIEEEINTWIEGRVWIRGGTLLTSEELIKSSPMGLKPGGQYIWDGEKYNLK